jgi:sec-independent protein translocase protein TatC
MILYIFALQICNMILSKFIGNKKKAATTEEGEEMGFFDHIEVLRWHILRSVLAIIVGAIFFFAFAEITFDTIIYGPKKPSFITYQFLCKYLPKACFYPPEFKLITRELGEQFFVHMKVSFWMGLITAFPYIFWEFWSFLKPGLYSAERKAVRGIVFYCSFLFFSGVAFGYFVIAPVAITWLASYSVGTEAESAPTLASYVNYMTMFTLPTGLMFELPIVFYFLGKIGVVTSKFLSSYRRHAIVIIFIIAAIVTPPDVVTQILIGTPILFLYEISIWVVKRIEKQNAIDEAKSATGSNLPNNA